MPDIIEAYRAPLSVTAPASVLGLRRADSLIHSAQPSMGPVRQSLS